MQPINRLPIFNLRSAFKHAALACLCLFIFTNTYHAQVNAGARYEIDAKRIGVYPDSKDALPRSREFIRLDSTYYVGWMYEGLYKIERASDHLGYEQAILPLRKALHLFEKDFGFKIQTIFSSLNYFQQNNNLFNDFYNIISNLESCYNSIEMPDSSMVLFNKLGDYNFQRDFFYVGCGRAWLYHRNRFYTSEKHPFLKNSIAENEVMAFNECYKQIELIKKNKEKNDYWYGPYQSAGDLLYVYHYLAILHDYNQNYDSSDYYYQRLIEGGRVSWSNYANMQMSVGNFSEAMLNYSKPEYKKKFALVEADYYSPTLLVYGGHTKEAIKLAQTKINENGSTPGFGWYNIALARGYLYDGQLDSCDFCLNKASNFKELHINTTLTQSQYEFTINLLRIQMLEKKMAQIKFSDTGWWYSFGELFDLVSLKIQKLMLEYSVVNALATNPERERLVYMLFCTEATTGFDEALYLLKDFCSPYFEAKYNSFSKADRRTKIIRYFRLFAAEFALQTGNTERAKSDCDQLLKETISSENSGADENSIDVNYEKLYAYRLLEMLAETNEDNAGYNAYRNKCYEAYPQMMLFSGIPVKMNVSFSGMQDDETVQSVIKEIKKCNIDFTDDKNVPSALLNFNKKGDTYQVIINVSDANNNQIVNNSEFLFKEKDGVGLELSMRLFGKGGAIKFEKAIN